MATFTLEGETYDVPDGFTIGEAFDAEQALGVDIASAGSAAQTLMSLLIAVRRRHPQRPVAEIVELLRAVDFTELAQSEAGAAEDLEDDPSLPLESGNGATAHATPVTHGS